MSEAKANAFRDIGEGVLDSIDRQLETNDKEKTKVIKCKIEWTMFKDIRAFMKVWVQAMKFSKVSTQTHGKNAEVRRRAAQLLNTVRTTGKNRDPCVEFIAMNLKARGFSFEK